jgi:hypothetical protein
MKGPFVFEPIVCFAGLLMVFRGRGDLEIGLRYRKRIFSLVLRRHELRSEGSVSLYQQSKAQTMYESAPSNFVVKAFMR